MNLFIFHEDTKQSARYFFEKDPKRARKQIVEATQMIAIAADQIGLPQLRKSNGDFYKTTGHRTHPCTLWVRESLQNFMFTVSYTLDLCTEYAKRSEKPHACHVTLINWLKLCSGWLSKHTLDLPKAEPRFFGDQAYMHKVSECKTVYEKYRVYLDNKLFWR